MRTTPILRLLLRHWLLIGIGTLVVSAGFFGFSKLQTPTYTATSSQYFSITTSQSGSALTQGASYVQDQMSSFNQLATSPLVLNKVIEVLNLKVTIKELSRAVAVNTPRDSVVMQISVTDESPEQAAAIANAIGAQLSEAVSVVGPQLSGGRAAVTVRFIQTALPPNVQSAPNTRQNTLIGFLVGLLLSCGVVIAIARLTDRVVEPGSLTDVTPAPLLGTIRNLDGLTASHLAIVADANSRAAEDLRRFRAGVEQLAGPSTCFMIAIASSVRSEGRSTITANLAAALAEAGRTVLVLEADFRHPSAPSGDHTEARPFDHLPSALADPKRLDEVVHRVDGAGFDVIAAGGSHVSPVRMLSSAEMELILIELRRRYEFILVDTPALLEYVDVTALAADLDGLVLLADSRRVRRAQLRNAQQLVDLAGIRTLGVVINRAPEGRLGSGFFGNLGGEQVQLDRPSPGYRLPAFDKPRPSERYT